MLAGLFLVASIVIATHLPSPEGQEAELPYLLAGDDLLLDVLELSLYRDLWRGTSDTVAPSGSR